jgi:hypothetical protein
MAQGRSPSGRSLYREIRYNDFRYSESYLRLYIKGSGYRGLTTNLGSRLAIGKPLSIQNRILHVCWDTPQGADINSR